MTSVTATDTHLQMDWQEHFPRVIYGGDYNPEQWPEHVWREDARLMREAGVNLVSVAIFAWGRSEPLPGVYDFAWLDAVIDILYEQGVRVNLGTGTAAPPPWLVKLHPEILPVTDDGVTLQGGTRRHYSPHSRAYREHAARFVAALAEHYRDHPALAMWHVDNEYSCHIAECFGPEADDAFRAWLRERYGTIEHLNHSWGTAFWGQIYSEWDEVRAPRRAPYIHNPSTMLDWKRFSSDAWLACYDDQFAILRRITPHVPVTTNFMGFNKPLDYWKWATHEDLVANDSYPDPASPHAGMTSALECDLMRSLGRGKPWVLMEQVTSHVNWRERNATKRPGQMRAGSLQAFARGANGIMFFQWRASQAGGEQFHGAMLPHAGPETRTFREVAALGTELGQLDALRSSRVRADVAIIFDYESWWALELPGKPSEDVRYMDGIRAWYAPFYARSITVDFVHPTHDLSAYRLVLAPHLFMLSDEAAANINRHVAGGGTFVTTYLSGIVNDTNQVGLGGYPAALRSLLGMYVEEWAPFAHDQSNTVITDDEEAFRSELWADVIQLEGATPIARFLSDYYGDHAAITRHIYGNGSAYYVGTSLDSSGMEWFTARLCDELGLQTPPEARAGVEVVQRHDGQHTWRFVLNYGSEPVTISLRPHERDLLSGHTRGVVTLAQYGVAVLTESTRI